MTYDNIILIGMPGAGKSTLGVQLAKMLAMDFVDTDLLIQRRYQQSLQEIVDQQGHEVLRDWEADVVTAFEPDQTVVATGGSVVYRERSMAHLKRFGPVIYCYVSLPVLEQRVSNFASRGIAAAPGSSFASIFEEREPLYRQYADIVVDCDGVSEALALQRLYKECSND